MGKGGKKFKRGGGGRRAQRQDWNDIPKTNEHYENYYNTLGFIPEEEREAFWTAMRRDLPNSFRFTGSRGHALAVQQRLKDFYIPQITSITHEGGFVEPPRPVSWYPDQLAWSMTTPKNVIRRFAPFASFQRFLVAETDVGNITRQEVVSMIPPLLLDVRPGMSVLDLCAAPGSKSTQLMEMIHAGEEESIKMISERVRQDAYDPAGPFPAGLEDDGRTTGLLIANDSDYKRAHMLIHQMKRLNSPNIIVTNHDATLYPSIKLPSPPAESGNVQKNVYLKFDRILADVPCSGDGTARKNSNIWSDWVPGNALGLHLTQMRILVRALQMLKVGGRVVYSTCSMNPIENEAVVASAIERCGGSANVDIIDCSKELPSLKRAPGLTTWNVMDREGRTWNSWKEVQEYRESKGISGLGRLAEGMFPPSSEELLLERCLRVYPHLQDTGGFFIAVLEKKSEIRAKPEDSSKVIPKASVAAVMEELDNKNRDGNGEPLEKINALDDIVTVSEHANGKNATVAESTHQPSYTTTLEAPSSPGKRSGDHLEDEGPTKRTKLEDGTEAIIGDRPVHFPPPSVVEAVDEAAAESQTEPSASRPLAPKKRKQGQVFEEPFKYIDPDLQEIGEIFDFYGISKMFPRDRFMVRNAQGIPSKTIYYSSALVRDILLENEGRGLKFVHCGVKMFVKQDVQGPDVCRWRIQTDGLQILEPWVGPQRIVTLAKRETLRKLLIEMFPKVSGDGWKELGQIGEWVRDVSMGCCILRIEVSDAEDGFKEPMVLPLWRSLHSINLMLPKEDRRALLLRLFNDTTPLVNANHNQQAARASTPDSPGDKPAVPVDTETVADSDITYAQIEKDILPPAATTEEDVIKRENLALGQEEQDLMATRETWQRNGDEQDKFNTTV